MLTHMHLKKQRGALFGLDARIALAIFGLISIVAGYYSLSKLTTARYTAFLKELLNYESAILQIQTDLGVFYQFTIDGSDGIKDFNAIEDGTNILSRYTAKWNGPYIDGIARNHPLYGTYTINYRQANYADTCNISNDCYVWLTIDSIPENVFAFLNKYFDEDNGLMLETTPTATGRIQANGITDPRTLRFRTNAVRRAG